MDDYPSYFKYWGKASKNEDGSFSYHLLPYHCLGGLGEPKLSAVG